MSTIDDFTKAYREAMPEQFAGTVNLMAHPLAGMAAASALGLGLAGQAFGMWAGAIAGATEASQKLFAGLVGEDAPRRQPQARLRLVTSEPVPRRERVKAVEAAPAPVSAQPAAIERPARPDDLKAISGIGPKLEKTLNGLGIWTYGQIAALGPAEIAWLDERLGFAGRIGRDDWTGQAGRLAGSQGI